MKRNKGFTLVELISVIALLLVLSVLAVVAYSNITDAARNAAIQSDANTLARAINSFNSVVNSSGRIEGGSSGVRGIVVNGDTFPLRAIAGVNAPVDMDLTVTVGSGRASAVLNMLSWVPSTGGTGGIWVVDPEGNGGAVGVTTGRPGFVLPSSTGSN